MFVSFSSIENRSGAVKIFSRLVGFKGGFLSNEIERRATKIEEAASAVAG